jgi:hypothetical protein
VKADWGGGGAGTLYRPEGVRGGGGGGGGGIIISSSSISSIVLETNTGVAAAESGDSGYHGL